jgi:uncharacterized protein (UPF0332 family)
MSFNPEDLLALAQELDAEARHSGNGKSGGLREAKFRAAISRAYYAAFWSGRLYFQNAQPPQLLSNFGPHLELQHLFGNYAGQAMKTITINLQQLHKLRNRADYDAIVRQLEEESARALRLANRLLNDIGNLPSDPTQAP